MMNYQKKLEELEEQGGELVGFMNYSYQPVSRQQALVDFQREMFTTILEEQKLEISEKELLELREYIMSVNFEELVIRFQHKEYDGIWMFSFPIN